MDLKMPWFSEIDDHQKEFVRGPTSMLLPSASRARRAASPVLFASAAVLLLAATTAFGGIAAAETAVPKPKPDASAEEPAKVSDFPTTAVPTGAATPYAPPITANTGTPSDGNEGTVYLVSRLTDEGKQLDRGMVWRVYSDKPDAEGRLPLIANAAGGAAEFRLEPGSYLIHAGFGYAGSTKRVNVAAGEVHSETIVLNAGGLKLGAELAENRPLDESHVTFDVFANDPDGPAGPQSRRLVANKVKAGAMLRLNAGTYYVVSAYGGINAEVRADIRVQPGKLTEATVYHKAARITLKLVNEPGGDQLVESVGAFPSFILAEGDYAVAARHNDQVFNRDFSVESGIDREVEVVAARH